MKRPSRRAVYSSLALLIGLSGCGALPQSLPKPVEATVTLVASADVNPDISGRSSPIVVRLLVLSDSAAFVAATYDALSPDSTAALGASRLSETRVIIRPGEQRELGVTIDSRAKAIGVVAEYANIFSSQWRAVHAGSGPIGAELKKKQLIVSAERDRVTVRTE